MSDDAPLPVGRLRLLVFIVACNAARTIESVLRRIPPALVEHYDIEVLAIDDASPDATFETAHRLSGRDAFPFPVTVLRNPADQGYGGNQKIGFRYAIENRFDFVALVHGDGRYAPECLPDLAEPLRRGEADAVFGSRTMESGAAKAGGMPRYKRIGNRALTAFRNRALGLDLSEFHSGYRLYSVPALAAIPFALNADDFHFDTEIVIQLVRAGMRIRERAIPTYYGDEISHANALRYGCDVALTTLRARLQDLGLLYDRKYDCRADDGMPYRPGLDFPGPHSEAVARLHAGQRVVDIGTGDGHVAEALIAKGCRVTGVERAPPGRRVDFERFLAHDLDTPLPDGLLESVDAVLLLDVIERLRDPEWFVESLRARPDLATRTEILVSTGNVAFAVTRFGLLSGGFNYGKSGILDRTRTRLFTFATVRRLFRQAGFDVVERKGLPAPFPLALGRGALADALLALNRLAIRIWPGLFAYRIFLRVRKRPTLADLLTDARRLSPVRAEAPPECPNPLLDQGSIR